MPFRDPEAGDLATRISAGVRQRIEDAVEATCLDTLVSRRRARGLPAPRADSRADREEYERLVRQFLLRLQADLVPLLSDHVQVQLPATEPKSGQTNEQLVAIQVTLARQLPDYWQRFDAIRMVFAGEAAASSGERGSFLRRLFGSG